MAEAARMLHTSVLTNEQSPVFGLLGKLSLPFTALTSPGSKPLLPNDDILQNFFSNESTMKKAILSWAPFARSLLLASIFV
jgi:hypothetical protein